MKLNPKDEYVILADMIDWAAVEAEYSALFKSRRGRPAASVRLYCAAVGDLAITGNWGWGMGESGHAGRVTLPAVRWGHRALPARGRATAVPVGSDSRIACRECGR